MYLIVAYDVHVKRVFKVMKFLRMYLHHVQNSVFEGKITESGYKELIEGLLNLINKEEDSVLVYQFRKKEVFRKRVFGIEKNLVDNIF